MFLLLSTPHRAMPSSLRSRFCASPLAPFSRRLLRLLAGRANAGKLQRVADAGVTALLGDLVFKSLDHAFVERLDLVAGAANQVVMVMMSIPRLDFVPRRPVDPGHPLHQRFLFENRNKTKHSGEVAAFLAHLFVNVGQGEGNCAAIEQLHDRDATMGGPQPVLAQPRGGIDGVGM
jgi:hypothetical protein